MNIARGPDTAIRDEVPEITWPFCRLRALRKTAKGTNMSGGHWDYEQYKIKDVCDRVAYDLRCPPDPERSWMVNDPELGRLISEIGNVLSDTIHDLDYHISGDSLIKDQEQFRAAFKEKLMKIVQGQGY